MEIDKKQELKDFSLCKDVLIYDFCDDDIEDLFPTPKHNLTSNDDPNDDPVIVERFVDAAIEHSQRGKTENMAETFLTSADPRVDFFFQVLEDTKDDVIISLLEKSWNFNSLDTLRMIAYLRDIRSGKSIRYQYYVCLYWLYSHHPRTLLQNIRILLHCGYWKDPLQLLMIVLFNGKVGSYLFQEEYNGNPAKKRLITQRKQLANKGNFKHPRKEVNKLKLEFYDTVHSEFNEMLVKHYKDDIDKRYKVLVTKKRKTEKVKDRKAHEIDRKYLKELIQRYARERFAEDKKYRYFHLKIAEMFAKQLIDDLANATANNTKEISLAAKWAPSLQGQFDKYTLIGSSIALQIVKLTRAQNSSLDEIFSKPIPIATYLARKHYHKNYLVLLRQKLQIPELFMCSNQWNLLPYHRVSSKCMQKNRTLFMVHDRERFEQFIKSREKIVGATLKPPELVQRARHLSHVEESEKELLEKQWNSLRDSIKVDNNDTCFKSALSICDVSGSMRGTPMHAAIGLTLMTMSFTREPWCNLCLTFSRDPSFVHFETNEPFYQKVDRLSEADAGLNTDLYKTFKLIVGLGKKYELKQSEMPKYLFIYSDMEFDCACNPSETNFEEAKRLFTETGYEMPTIVFWNLRDSKSIPIQKNEQGTILLSGYSAQQLRHLLNMNIDQITALTFMEDALKKYNDLVVID